MPNKPKHDYPNLYSQAQALIQSGAAQPTFLELAERLDVPLRSLIRGFKNIGVTARDLRSFRGIEEKPNDQQTGMVEEGNYLQILTPRVNIIRTEEELIKACKIDLEYWQKEKIKFNAWPTSMKLETTGEVVQVQNFQVDMRLVRRRPLEIKPAIYPVAFDVDRVALPKGRRSGLKRDLVIPDVHFGFSRNLQTGDLMPFHDTRVLDIAQQLRESLRFERVHVIGDWQDMTDWSLKFPAPPDFRNNTQAALIIGRYWLAALGVTNLIEGNHDERPGKAILAYNQVEAYGLRPADQLEGWPVFSVPYLLGLDSLKINYASPYPDAEVWINPEVRLIHGEIVRGKSLATASAVLEQSNHTTVFGHIHRAETASKRVRADGGGWKEITAFCPGCACHVDGRVPGSKQSANWNQGLGVVTYSDEGFHSVERVKIVDGRAIYAGQVIEARDRAEEMAELVHESLRKIDDWRKENVLIG